MDGCPRDVLPERRVVRALVLPAPLDLSAPLGAKKDRAAAEQLMDGVDARRAPRLLF